MKKSYLMLGLVAAALSSCSNDDSMPVAPSENKLPGTENLEPIRLSMSTTSADVQVGTRGTGTVGSTDADDNIWQFEDIYLLMTTNDTLCMQPTDEVDGKYTHNNWGFTSVRGKGPFLLEQFDGSFWARPAFISTNIDPTKDNVWTLDYTVDKNEWWYGAPIDKFYPQKGASQFFAYYIDDAVKTKQPISTDLIGKGRTANHEYPTISDKYATIQDNVIVSVAAPDPANNKVANVKTVDFKIDGSQDLMAGYAKLPQIADNAAQKTLADQDGGFSAQSARADVIPQITMKHLLSRLTFEVVKGDANFDKVTLDGIQVMSKTDGQMVVAANVDDKVQTGLAEKIGAIVWDGAENPVYSFVNLKQDAATAYKAYKVSSADASKNQLVTDEDALITFSYDANGDDDFDDAADGDLKNLAAYWTPEDGLYYLASKQEKVVLTAAQIEEIEALVVTNTTSGTSLGYKVNEDGVCLDQYGRKIIYKVDETTSYEVKYDGTNDLHYIDGTSAVVPLDPVDFPALVELFEPTVYEYKINGENKCLDEGGNSITYTVYGQNYDLLWTSAEGVHYYKTITEPEVIPTGAVYSADRVVVYEKKDNTLENGKAKLIDFISLDLRDLNLVTKKESEDNTNPATFGKEISASVGEAMFVSPGDTEYKMLVKMTYLVREAQDNAISDKFEEGGALTEEITLPLTLKLPQVGGADVPFKAGFSYNIKVTIYGLKEVVADVELTKWENGGEIGVGEDDTVENVTP